MFVLGILSTSFMYFCSMSPGIFAYRFLRAHELNFVLDTLLSWREWTEWTCFEPNDELLPLVVTSQSVRV